MVKKSKVADVPLIGMVSLILIVEYFNRLQLATISENERSHTKDDSCRVFHVPLRVLSMHRDIRGRNVAIGKLALKLTSWSHNLPTMVLYKGASNFSTHFVWQLKILKK